MGVFYHQTGADHELIHVYISVELIHAYLVVSITNNAVKHYKMGKADRCMLFDSMSALHV